MLHTTYVFWCKSSSERVTSTKQLYLLVLFVLRSLFHCLQEFHCINAMPGFSSQNSLQHVSSRCPGETRSDFHTSIPGTTLEVHCSSYHLLVLKGVKKEAPSLKCYSKWSQECHLFLHLVTQQRGSRQFQRQHWGCTSTQRQVQTYSDCLNYQTSPNRQKCCSDLTTAWK